MNLEYAILAVGNWISAISVVIIVLGVLVTIVRLLNYLLTGFNDAKAAALRHSLMIYISLSLDFLIAKDVVVTLSLKNGDYPSLIQLAVVVLIRVLLSYFVRSEQKMSTKSKA